MPGLSRLLKQIVVALVIAFAWIAVPGVAQQPGAPAASVPQPLRAFRPVTADPSWRTPTVVALASQMYESRDFGAMPILADAFQDAGCDNTDILDHCRDEKQVHVRGCWVVDLVLGKE